MVRKSSLLGKLFTRKKTPNDPVSPVRRTAPAGTGKVAAGGNGKGPRGQVKEAVASRREAVSEPPPPKAEVRPIKKEDAQKAVVRGLQDLSNLLQGIQERMENQGEKTGKLLETFKDLPEAAQAQIEFLKKISQQMEAQHGRTTQLLERFSQIPELLDGIQKILEAQQSAEARRDQTLSRFRETMERINSSISSLSQDNAKAMREAAQTFEKTHAQSVQTFEKSQRQTLEVFQKAQETHSKALGEFLASTRKQNKAILVFLVLTFLVMAGILVGMFTGLGR